MGTSIDLTKKVYIFFNKDAKYAKNINTDAKKKSKSKEKKNKNKNKRRQRKLSKASSACRNGGNNDLRWDLWGRGL